MNKLIIYYFLVFSIASIHAQDNGDFYFSLNVNQDYKDNVFAYHDSSKINDSRFRSSFLVGYNDNISILSGNWGVSYENRYQQYFKLSDYTRMQHILKLSTSLLISNNNSLYFNDNFRARNYKNIKTNNYYRNTFLIYLKSMFTTKIDFFVGYKNRIKNYPNNLVSQNYLSHRPFIKFNYQLNRTTNIGAKTEFQWHNGNLYPNRSNIISKKDFSGSRYLLEILGNKIINNNLFVDVTYRLEYDVPNDINIQSTGDNDSDEEPEDLLIEDPDYDYLKNQLAFSFLYRIDNRMSLFSFIVFQNKAFNNWRIVGTGNTLRSDQFFYSSIMLKYKLLQEFRISVNYNYENRNSNLTKMNYHRNTISFGLQYNF